MSISGALNNALTGLTASSRLAEVVSSNISNALTDGYARRVIELSSKELGGVSVDGIDRMIDRGLIADRRLADAQYSGQSLTADMLSRLESGLGAADDPSNIGSRIAAVEAALIRASGDPSSELRLTQVADAFGAMIATFDQNNDDIQNLREEADRTIDRQIATLNDRLVQIAALNADVLRLSASGTDISGLLDARQRLIDTVAELVPIRVTESDNQTVRLMTTSGLTLLDGRPASFSFKMTPTITADMSLSSGALSGVLWDGQPLDNDDGIGRLDGGSIGAAFAMRDEILVNVQASLDTLAVDMVARFQDPANDPTLTAGDPGLVTVQGNSLNPLDVAGLAGRLTLNPLFDPSVGGGFARIRDGLNGPVLAPNSDATQINRWIVAFSELREDLPLSGKQSLSARAADFTSRLGATRLSAETDASFSQARLSTLTQAELAQGVDTDQELQTLLKVEQSYGANAKVIETVDFLIRRLLEI
ncbi:flagellar hook-associated protein FlgK [Yoonia litorea]|uniref:Flagellar hook-associated protein 1 n=1 Tax=Yoonia litorea TaxID=1123755 RepID=A0A1I6MUA5_9RHOB|nr:flagellar hook-associated protein FlgK [Yoonia litorea]SFS19292.1 flagellar hook-associated protein 1 FlgK [Yoonia litorea]